jgi:hypothetical protein
MHIEHGPLLATAGPDYVRLFLAMLFANEFPEAHALSQMPGLG